MRHLAIATCLATSVFGVAYADDVTSADTVPPPAMSAKDPAATAVSPITIVQGNGVKVGEGNTVYPVLGVETGFISNVFYDDTNEISAGLLRVLGEVGFGTLSPVRLEDAETPEPTSVTDPRPDKGSFQYRADLYGAWNQYLSDNDRVTAQGGFNAGAVVRGIVNPERPISVGFLDHFARVLRPTNFETNQNTNRDINTLNVRLNYQPLGRSLGGYVYYMHNLDLFEEDNQQFADRFDHTFGVRVNYQWLPLTRLYVDVSQGVFRGIGSSSTKVASNPFTAVAGIMSVLSLNLTVNARIGYTNGFYASGPSFGTVTGGVQVGYRYSPLGRALLLYSYEHQDSINANFFRDHVLRLTVEQQLSPVWLFVRPEVHFREYEGLLPQIMSTMPTRDDTIVAVIAGVRYNFRDWLAATLEYNLASDQTDFRYNFMGGPIDDPSYVRHELMIGIRGAL